MKTLHLVAALACCLCSKILCSTSLFLFEESEDALSNVALLASAVAAILALRFLDAAFGSPVVRAMNRIGTDRREAETPADAR